MPHFTASPSYDACFSYQATCVCVLTGSVPCSFFEATASSSVPSSFFSAKTSSSRHTTQSVAVTERSKHVAFTFAYPSIAGLPHWRTRGFESFPEKTFGDELLLEDSSPYSSPSPYFAAGFVASIGLNQSSTFSSSSSSSSVFVTARLPAPLRKSDPDVHGTAGPFADVVGAIPNHSVCRFNQHCPFLSPSHFSLSGSQNTQTLQSFDLRHLWQHSFLSTAWCFGSEPQPCSTTSPANSAFGVPEHKSFSCSSFVPSSVGLSCTTTLVPLVVPSPVGRVTVCALSIGSACCTCTASPFLLVGSESLMTLGRCPRCRAS
mmetsp:Transcript_3670/g.13570  ORF Transcript_3670/g.13570 Transcript_3670/m.13570 type:complete len:318 (-) Transcript_3670:203-1156(-)